MRIPQFAKVSDCLWANKNAGGLTGILTYLQSALVSACPATHSLIYKLGQS